MQGKIRSIVCLIKLKIDLLKNKKLDEISGKVTKKLKAIDIILQVSDFNRFKQEMIDIQENITNLKKSSKKELQNIRKTSEDLNDELNLYYNEKVDDWNESYTITANFDINSKIKSKTGQRCKVCTILFFFWFNYCHLYLQEVNTFLDFIYQSGGCENGWSKEDHLLFLKYRARYKNINDVATRLHEQLPGNFLFVIGLAESNFSFTKLRITY